MTVEQSNPKVKIDDVLSFKETGRQIEPKDVSGEFELMKDYLKKPFTVEVATRVCEKSGTHLLKMVSPRVDTNQAVLYFDTPGSNERPRVLPSVNAPDIPFCKIIYRPLEIAGRPGRSVIDHIMNPDDASESILGAFASVFGQDVLDAVKAALLEKANGVTSLASGEFPIVFVPRTGGGDLQITPVSPATAFMGVKDAINALHERKKSDGMRLPRDSFENQSISSKPQNISGAIGGPRRRVMAKMPDIMKQSDAEIYRYVRGGSFPRWREHDVADWVIRYADMLERDKTYNNRDTRAALDNMADRLIGGALDFIDEILAEVRFVAEADDIEAPERKNLPEPAKILLRRWWSESDFNKARKALTDPHFKHRVKHFDTRKSQA